MTSLYTVWEIHRKTAHLGSQVASRTAFKATGTENICPELNIKSNVHTFALKGNDSLVTLMMSDTIFLKAKQQYNHTSSFLRNLSSEHPPFLKIEDLVLIKCFKYLKAIFVELRLQYVVFEVVSTAWFFVLMFFEQ